MARLGAEELLTQGMHITDLNLRHVAQHLGVPLSTLTYVYSSTEDLLEDMSTEYRQRWGTVIAEGTWDRGLRTELEYIGELYYERILCSPFRVAMAEYEIIRTFNGHEYTPAAGSDGGLIDLIGHRSGERYRVPGAVMAGMMGVFGNGVLLLSARIGPEDTLPVLRACIQAMIALADPH